MLTEYASDPRRANWLTISSMSEDLSWPEETNITRPSWELEAEILRLTTRLMMRERELRQVKSQLKCQASKTQQQAALWRRRVEEKEEQMRLLLVQKDAEMQSIVSQLLLFESELRREQSRIEGLLSERDAQISLQQQEIEQLKQSLDSNKPNSKDPTANSSVRPLANGDSQPQVSYHLSQELPVFEDPTVVETREAVCKLREGLMKIRAIQDVTNVKSLDVPKEVVFLEKKKVPSSYRAPQKMKDLKAKRVNSHKMHRPVIADFTGQAIL